MGKISALILGALVFKLFLAAGAAAAQESKNDAVVKDGMLVSLQYKLSPRVIISGTRDQNGGFSFDTRIRKSW